MSTTQCYKCGRNIPKESGLYLVMKTGSYSSGQDYYRNVNISPRCNAGQDGLERAEKGKKALLIVLAVVLASAAGVYWLFIR